MENRIQSFWFGKEVSRMERLSISSFLKNGHTFDIYTYNEINGLPTGVNQLDANKIIPRDRLFYDSSGGVASFSDWFRYQMLFEKGGWWVDLDVICLKPFEVTQEYCFATENFSANYETGITNCVIKSKPKAEFLKTMLKTITPAVNQRKIIWGEFGPTMINSAVIECNLSEFVMPVKAFCPIDWTDAGKIAHDDLELPTDSFAIHMWNNLWRINSIDKERSYSPASIYEQLKLKYL